MDPHKDTSECVLTTEVLESRICGEQKPSWFLLGFLRLEITASCIFDLGFSQRTQLKPEIKVWAHDVRPNKALKAKVSYFARSLHA